MPSLVGNYAWSLGKLPLSVRETEWGLHAFSGTVRPFPWDRGTFLDVKNGTIRMEGVFNGGEIQQLYGSLFQQGVRWSDGTHWERTN